MRRMLAGGMLVSAGVIVGGMMVGVSVAGTGGGGGLGAATQNGDVNGDGELDIGDAVYTLVHLFKGGPAPVVCADSPDLLARVAMLEARSSALELGAAANQQQLAAFDVDLQRLTRDYVVWGKSFDARFSPGCTGQAGAYKEGVGEFGPIGDDPVVLRRGEFVGGELVFETDRDSDLLLEVDFIYPSVGGGMHLILDGDEHAWVLNGRPSGATRGEGELESRLLLDIPAGRHTLSARGSCTCPPTSGGCDAVMRFRYFSLRYVD